MVGRPFALETEQPAVTIFDIVDLFTVVGTPEVVGAVDAGVRAFFQALGHHEVFPQRADVISGIEQVVLADDGIAHSVVEEVVFGLTGH